MVESLLQVLRQLKNEGRIRLAHGVINEWVVHWALRVAGECGIPGEPSCLYLLHLYLDQLHSTIPHRSRWLGYFTSACVPRTHAAFDRRLPPNYLCFTTRRLSLYKRCGVSLLDLPKRDAGFWWGMQARQFQWCPPHLLVLKIFPMVSRSGQRAALHEVLELCPTNKILWSSKQECWLLHSWLITKSRSWWPLASRVVLSWNHSGQTSFVRREPSSLSEITLSISTTTQVLSEMVLAGELTEIQAVTVVERALFWNSDRIYKLNLKPNMKITEGFKLHWHRPHYLSWHILHLYNAVYRSCSL